MVLILWQLTMLTWLFINNKLWTLDERICSLSGWLLQLMNKTFLTTHKRLSIEIFCYKMTFWWTILFNGLMNNLVIQLMNETTHEWLSLEHIYLEHIYIHEFHCPTREWAKWVSEPMNRASVQSKSSEVERCGASEWSERSERSERCERTTVASDRVAH